jgi:hypothetical protein
MLIPKTRKPRRFDYEPRYYDPTEDNRFKRRLRFTSSTRRGRRPPFLFLAILLMLVMIVYLAL